jgi:hypothetical protein
MLAQRDTQAYSTLKNNHRPSWPMFKSFHRTAHTNHIVDQFSASSADGTKRNARVNTCVMNRLVSTTGTELLRTTLSANSSSTHELARCTTQDRATAVHSPRHRLRRERKFMQRQRGPAEFRRPRQCALICRWLNVHTVDEKRGVGRGASYTVYG